MTHAKSDNMDLRLGDCLEVMAEMPENSVDAIVTDPPYGLSFMGQNWDHGVPGEAFWREAIRVAKPGCHLLAFGGTRMVHRLAVAIEDAGWEIRDRIHWVYGSGFPKSHDVSKAIDKAAGVWRGRAGEAVSENGAMSGPNYQRTDKGEPATDLARQWDGWGTALKPAVEPIIFARKPFKGTVAANVQQWGTGAINVDGCRVGTEVVGWGGAGGAGGDSGTWNKGTCGLRNAGDPRPVQGRWPANLIHDGSEEVVAGFPVTAGGGNSPKIVKRQRNKGWVNSSPGEGVAAIDNYGDSGSAARFFYCPKASKRDRNSGLDNIEHVYIVCSWENEDREVLLRVDTEASPPRVIGASTVGCDDATLWNMLLFGNEIMVPFQSGCRFTISTATNLTTTSPTLNWLTRLLTSGCIAGANCETASGTSHAVSVGTSIQWEMSTGTCPKKDGRNTDDASGVTFEWLLQRSRSVSVTDAKPYSSSHPTVKPTDLMRYLCRLITPPGGVVLDPFMGSGSTGKAALIEGFRFIGIEREAEYLAIAEARIKAVLDAIPIFSGDTQ